MPMGVEIGGGEHTCMKKFRVNGVGLGVKGGGVGGHFQIFLVLVHVHECIERLGSLVFGKFFGLTGDFFSIYRGGGGRLGRCWAWGNCESVTDSLHCNFDDLY